MSYEADNRDAPPPENGEEGRPTRGSRRKHSRSYSRSRSRSPPRRARSRSRSPRRGYDRSRSRSPRNYPRESGGRDRYRDDLYRDRYPAPPPPGRDPHYRGGGFPPPDPYYRGPPPPDYYRGPPPPNGPPGGSGRPPPNRGGGGGGRRRRDEGPPGVSLLVRNLSPDIMQEDLTTAFGRIGEIRDVYIPRDFHSQQPKGFAFIEFASADGAREARDEMDRFVIKGREMEVVFAQERRKTPDEMRSRVVNSQNRGERSDRNPSFERRRDEGKRGDRSRSP